MFGVDGEFGIDEENDGLFDGVQTGEGSAIGTGGTFHFDEALRIDVDADQNIFVANSRGFQNVSAAISFNSLHISLTPNRRLLVSSQN